MSLYSVKTEVDISFSPERYADDVTFISEQVSVTSPELQTDVIIIPDSDYERKQIPKVEEQMKQTFITAHEQPKNRLEPQHVTYQHIDLNDEEAIKQFCFYVDLEMKVLLPHKAVLFQRNANEAIFLARSGKLPNDIRMFYKCDCDTFLKMDDKEKEGNGNSVACLAVNVFEGFINYLKEEMSKLSRSLRMQLERVIMNCLLMTKYSSYIKVQLMIILSVFMK